MLGPLVVRLVSLVAIVALEVLWCFLVPVYPAERMAVFVGAI